MEKTNSNENFITIFEIIAVLKKSLVKMIIAAIIAAVLAFTYTKLFIVPMYRSDAKMVIKVVSNETLTTYSDVQIAVGLVNDCVEIIKSRDVMQQVIDELNLKCEPEELLPLIRISIPENTRVLRLSVQNADPKLAKKIADTICGISESVVASSVGVDSITTFEEPSTPTAPVSPNAAKNTVVGAFAGAFAVGAAAIFLKIINNKIYTAEDAENTLGISVLGTIPYIEEDEAPQQKKDNSESKKKDGVK